MTRPVDDAIMQWTATERSGLAVAFLRLALGVGFVSAVADRLGLWGPPGTSLVSWGNFHNFLDYTAKLNPWCPAACLPLLGVIVTVAEAGLGILLTLGLFTRVAGLLSWALALTFAVAMTFVLGVHAPLSYSVFVFSAASLLLALQAPDGLSLDKFLELKHPHRERSEDSFANQENI